MADPIMPDPMIVMMLMIVFLPFLPVPFSQNRFRVVARYTVHPESRLSAELLRRIDRPGIHQRVDRMETRYHFRGQMPVIFNGIAARFDRRLEGRQRVLRIFFRKNRGVRKS